MKPLLTILLVLGFSIGTGLAGYWLGGYSEARIAQIRDSSSHATALLALQPELNSADPNIREHALWLELGDLRALQRKPNPFMSGDLAAMEVAITYAKLSQIHPSLGTPGRRELLMKHAVSACVVATSPNCNEEALSLMARMTRTRIDSK